MKGLTSLIAVILLAAGLSACSGDGATALEAAARQPAERPAAALAEPQNGWWWNPAESGSGYAIEQQGNQLFMAGFMYEASGASTWYVSTLTRQSQGSYSGAMTRYSGGQTLLGAYQSPT
ncbi:MAG: hypothetical protein RLZZ401_1197, partial [Pseudomonadota bacterium]